MGFSIVGLEANGGVTRGKGLIETAKNAQDSAPVGVGFSIVRLETNGCVESGEGLLETAKIAEESAQV